MYSQHICNNIKLHFMDGRVWNPHCRCTRVAIFGGAYQWLSLFFYQSSLNISFKYIKFHYYKFFKYSYKYFNFSFHEISIKFCSSTFQTQFSGSICQIQTFHTYIYISDTNSSCGENHYRKLTIARER